LGVHNHQPIGNPPEILENIYQRAYLPFIEILAEHPTIKATLHYCGVLLSWFLENHPDFLDLLKKLVERGQIELRTDGFYEPILPIIPACDAIGQIKKLTEFLEKKLSSSPKGCWLAERVWEPHLPALLSEASVEYVVVDDFHFLSAGLKEKELSGYFITEAENHLLKIFPSSMELRYLIPFQPFEKTLDYLAKKADSESVIVTLDDDGEKFGAWPKTYEAVYEEGWLEKFFRTLEANNDWIKTSTFSECLEETPPAGRIYLPTASYPEMLEWALPAETAEIYENLLSELKTLKTYETYKPFLKGGFFRNFFVKYPEANRMHKKMWHVAEKVLKSNSKQALDELWKGQCNDAYWHGVFGGLYLPHLRSSIYESLIKAEVLAEESLLKEKPRCVLKVIDFDKDGQDEVLIGNSSFSLYLSPARGGAIFELDYRPKFKNLLDVLTRRKEAYHQGIKEVVEEEGIKTIHEMVKAKEEGLERYLFYDSYERLSLIDHFFEANETLEGFIKGACKEVGNFLLAPYEILDLDKFKLTIELGYCGEIRRDEKKLPLLVKKRISLKDFGVVINYEIKNLSQATLNLLFGVEFNLSPNTKAKRYTETEVSSVELVDETHDLKVSFEFEDRPSILSFPIETVSLSEEGFERIYQGLSLLSSWELALNGEETFKTEFFMKIKE
jgi:alpha-amylase